MANTSLLGSYGGIDGSALMFRNRIINGDMRIDQRNAGAAVTPSSGATYVIDRFALESSVASKFTFRQVSTVSTDTNYEAGAAPSGFTNSLKISVASSYTPAATENTGLFQQIEGFNIADFAWGTADAKPITMSFWIKGSVVGKYTFHFRNTGETRTYLSTITINTANTWEYKTITVPGCTDGTWLVNNQRGLLVSINLGAGANFKGAAGSWLTTSGTPKLQSSDSVDFVTQANGSTIYMTGWQIEAGAVATPFERRPFGMELALCQRYFEKSYNLDVVPGTATSNGILTRIGVQYSNLLVYSGHIHYKVQKRTIPALVKLYSHSGAADQWHYGVIGSTEALGNATPIDVGFNGFGVTVTTPSVSGQNAAYGHWTASAEL